MCSFSLFYPRCCYWYPSPSLPPGPLSQLPLEPLSFSTTCPSLLKSISFPASPLILSPQTLLHLHPASLSIVAATGTPLLPYHLALSPPCCHMHSTPILPYYISSPSCHWYPSPTRPPIPLSSSYSSRHWYTLTDEVEMCIAEAFESNHSFQIPNICLNWIQNIGFTKLPWRSVIMDEKVLVKNEKVQVPHRIRQKN